MPIDRKFWSKDSFYDTEYDVPEWQCPTCSKAMLKLKKDSLQYANDSGTVRWNNSENWEEGHDTGVFSCIFECQNKSCGEGVSCCGTCKDDRVGEYGDVVNKYFPRMFVPTLMIMPIPTKCPKNIALEIRSAFSLFWCDLPGSMNHLRKSVELILDRMRIAKFPAGSTSTPLPLHQRIGLFRKTDKDLADRLEAIKWLGNVGSHSTKTRQKQFFDACDLLDDFIQSHFEKRGKRIVALTASTIKRKGR